MNPEVSYLVTRSASELPDRHQIIMVDGRVPEWKSGPDDHCWDHHRPGGARIQADELPTVPYGQTTLARLSTGVPICIATPLLDADAAVAAAWLQLDAATVQQDALRKLRAIAFDCDHLGVPPEYSDLAEFAASAVAHLKAEHRASVSTHSVIFQHATEWLIGAASGEREWPGHSDLVADYWHEVEVARRQLLEDERLIFLEGVAIVDVRGMAYVDPRAINGAVDQSAFLSTAGFTGSVLAVRAPDGEMEGLAYTLGSHPQYFESDYRDVDMWRILTRAEANRRDVDWLNCESFFGTSEFSKVAGFDAWGGRDTVGGSGWRDPSLLQPSEVAALVAGAFHGRSL